MRVLAQLPEYFTTDTHDEVRTSMPEHRAWVASDDAEADAIVGFVLAERRYPRSAEITYAAVLPERRHAGIGTALVQRALEELARDGVEVVEVKTLDASAGYEPYVADTVVLGGPRLRADRLHRPIAGLGARQSAPPST